MTTPTQQAEELARQFHEGLINLEASLNPKASKEETEKTLVAFVLSTIPPIELLEVARAAKQNSGNSVEIGRALNALQQKGIEL